MAKKQNSRNSIIKAKNLSNTESIVLLEEKSLRPISDYESELFSCSNFEELPLDSNKNVGDYFTFNPLNKTIKGINFTLKLINL